MRSGHRVLTWAGLLAITAAAATQAAAHPVKAAPAPIGFAVPTVADPIKTYGEPDIGIDNKGRVFVSGPTGTGTQRSGWSGSVDGGQTYREVTQCAVPSQVGSCTFPLNPDPFQGTNAVPGGGDTEIVFDNKTGAGQPGMYFSDLYALTCFRVEASHDGGATTTNQAYPGGCAGNPPTADRQWQAVYDPQPLGITSTSAYYPTYLANASTPLIYLVYNGGGGCWTKSNDGVNYTVADGGTCQFGNDGYPAIDQVTGKVFEAAGNGNCLDMNIGTPDASGNLTFISTFIHIACGLQGSPDVHWAVLYFDSARNLHAEWTIGSSTPSQDQVFTAAAPANNTLGFGGCSVNCWNNWTITNPGSGTTPGLGIQVSDGQVATGDAVNSFSWGVAGGPGRADVAWYGGDQNTDPNNVSGQVWNLFMSQVTFPVDVNGAVTGPPALSGPIKASPHPMHYNDICGAGTGCILQQGNRNLADFFKIAIDSTGAAEIVYDDTSNGLCQVFPPFTPTGNQTADHCGAPVVTVVRQDTGPGLFGTNVTDVNSTSPTPITGIDDTAADLATPDGLYPVIGGTSVPATELTASSLSLSGSTLTVTMKVADIRAATSTAALATIGGATALDYVTRWIMATPSDTAHPFTVFYAGMTGNDTVNAFYAGPAQSSDLCSVSACFPHVQLYPESAAVSPATPISGSGESGSVTCPATPTTATPCVITISVNVADVGSPSASSLLQEVGAYAFAVSHPQVTQTNAQSQADNVPLEIDGVCCYNFQGQSVVVTPEVPWTPALLVIGAGLIAAGALARRRRRAGTEAT